MLALSHLKWPRLAVTPRAVTVMPGTPLTFRALAKCRTTEMGDNIRKTAILNASVTNWVKAIPFYF